MSSYQHTGATTRVVLRHILLWLLAACVSLITAVAVVGFLHGGSPFALADRPEAEPLGFDCGGNNAAVVTFRGARYRPKTLERSWLRARAPLGDAIVESSAGCPEGARMHVYGLLGVPPRRALSRGGSSRKILVRADACPVPATESAVLRCLRGR
jgi:hypothetical protein